MIPLCFPQALLLNTNDAPQIQLRAYRPEPGTVLDLSRVYLFLEETYQAMHNSCKNCGLEHPIPLMPGIIEEIPDSPMELKNYWQSKDRLTKVKICLINGGGGGLGDAVMFAPALKILAAHLKTQKGSKEVELDVFSVLPIRTGAILNGIPGVRVLPIPLTLQDFTGYDFYTDFSGMMQDESFNNTHMTDLALQQMGLDPAAVPDSSKSPHLPETPVPEVVRAALSQARQAAGTRPLTAVIFTATKTRSMPADLAAAIMKEMLTMAQPVIIMPPGLDSKALMRRNRLEETAIDMSPVSKDFASYLAILNGMDIIISVDTSAVHLGAALGKPTIGIFSSIDHRLRVKYSNNVHPIQLSYTSKSCQAPCGLSKNRFYYQSTLSDGRPVSWDFGYSCSEAFDAKKMTSWLDDKLSQLDYSTSQAAKLDNIRREASERFTLESAPCWQNLKISTIMEKLMTIIT